MTDSFYPIQTGNSWTYRLSTGETSTNEITESGTDFYVTKTSVGDKLARVKIENNHHISDSFESGNFQTIFIDNAKVGDNWDIHYKANGIDCILKMNVLEISSNKEIEGKNYQDVMMIEGESVFSMNGNVIPSGMKTQYYYAKNVGAVLTTSSLGDYVPLIACELK